MKSVVLSDGDDCQLKMDQVILKTIRKSGFTILSTSNHFNTANSNYHGNEDKRHDDINDMECFIIYLDIHQLYPSRKEYIDALDWTKIYLTIQPEPASPTTITNIDRLVAAMDQSTIQGCS